MAMGLGCIIKDKKGEEWEITVDNKSSSRVSSFRQASTKFFNGQQGISPGISPNREEDNINLFEKYK